MASLNIKGVNLILTFVLLLSGIGFTYPNMNKNNSSESKSFQIPDYDRDKIHKKALSFAEKLSKEHAEKFGEVLVQSMDGRIKPFDTLALETVNKIHGSPNVYGLTYNQVALGMYLAPIVWEYIKWIKVKHPAVKVLLGINPDEKYASFLDFYDKNGRYKLADAVSNARRKSPARRNTFDKEVLKLDERLYIMYMFFNGKIMRIFPKKDDPNHTWYSADDAVKIFPPEQKGELNKILFIYYNGIKKGYESNDWNLADKGILAIKKFQRKYGSEVIPSETRIKAEILYNRLSIFEKLKFFYFLIGFATIVLIFIQIFNPKYEFKLIKNFLIGFLVITFLIHTVGLGLRWYIAGHAPWTDAYESMLFISWAVAFAGVVFARKSIFVLTGVSMFAGVFLFAAHLGWLDPQITTVVPVLKSYWLLIHVSVLTASYGFLGLSAILGILTLIMFIIKNERIVGKERVKKIENSIKEALKINEISLIIGLSLIIIGNFLGAIWANESWGRYWGWDPKETWTAVSIAVYASIVHLKYIKDWYSPYIMTVASVFGYFSILMTYFGVNYFLSGLHSYAAGEPFPIPTWVYYAIATLTILSVLSFFNRKLEK